MNLDMSRHAAKRCQQRAIAPIVVELVMRFGRCERSHEGTEKVFLDRAGRRELESYLGHELARAIQKQLDVYVVVKREEKVVTAAYRLERIKRH